MSALSTVSETFSEVAERLAAAGVASPRLDARLILAHALGAPADTVLLDRQRRLNAAESRSVESLAARRAAREPVSHLLGRREFWSLPFAVTAEVLDPRPDSETVVEAVLERLDDKHARVRILDFGTGTGCLLLALLAELPCAHGIGVDCSVAACQVAHGNTAALGLSGRAHFLVSDWGAALSGGFDVVVSNPPYVRDSEIGMLAPEVAWHEPRLALAGGPDGFDAYRRLGADIARLMAPSGFAVLEIGAGMGAKVRELFGESDLVCDGVRTDLGGVERALIMSHCTRDG